MKNTEKTYFQMLAVLIKPIMEDFYEYLYNVVFASLQNNFVKGYFLLH